MNQINKFRAFGDQDAVNRITCEATVIADRLGWNSDKQ